MSQNSNILYHFTHPVILVGGGTIDIIQLQKFATMGYTIIAADGGANALAKSDIIPHAIIGDLDSLEDIEEWQTKTSIHHQPNQDTTDFEKCLISIDAPLFLCFGFWGDDIGHSLACLHALAHFHTTKNIIILTATEAMCATDSTRTLTLAPDRPLSIYPLEPVTFAGSTGLLYPLNGLAMAQGTLIGTSNTTSQSRVTITPEPDHSGPYLIVIPVEFWRQASANMPAS